MRIKKIVPVFIVLAIVAFYTQTNIYKNHKLNKSKEDIQVISNIHSNKEIGEKNALNLIKKYLQKNNAYIADNIEVDSVDNKYYIIHVYDVIENSEESHTATTGWYQVDKYTGEIIDIMQ